jgi:peptidoglycan/LPS O-acetylase OafA/YrhL
VRDQNAFDFLRIAAASSVFLSHSFALYGLAEPHLFAHRDSLGTVAVAIFFAISGYLVTQSWDRSPSHQRFFLRRALRIFPGLAVAVFLTAFVIGPLATTRPLGAYLAAADTWSYFVGNTTLMVGASSLPGVFENNPVKGPNGSLWSLRHEVLMYALLMLAGLSRHFGRLCLMLFIGFLTAWVVAILVDAPRLAQALPYPWKTAIEVHAMRAIKLGAVFFGAGCLYLWRSRIPLSGKAAAGLCGMTLLVPSAMLSNILMVLAIPYVTLAVAFGVPVAIKRLVKHDISYGIYIYAFPLQQLVSGYCLAHQLGWMFAFAVSGLLTLLFALLSWFLVERPALELRPRTAISAAS